jgi:hypothetical protein
MAEISQADRQAALGNLEAAAQWLEDMASWADGDSPDRERCSIALEDAAKSVMVAAYLLERADRTRVSELGHRRMSSDGQGVPQPYQAQTGG